MMCSKILSTYSKVDDSFMMVTFFDTKIFYHNHLQVLDCSQKVTAQGGTLKIRHPFNMLVPLGNLVNQG